MADFNAALKKVLKWEGVYDNDPDDAGGETCFGITRAFEANWPGWSIVEDLQKRKVPASTWAAHEPLMLAVGNYYNKQWDTYALDGVPDDMAQCFFGGIINQGTGRVVRWLQSCLLAMGYAVTVDGNFGAATLAMFTQAACGTKADLLLDGLKAKRVSAYFDTAMNKEQNRKFLGGWLNRLNDGA